MIYKTSTFKDLDLQISCQEEDMIILDLFEDILKTAFLKKSDVVFIYKTKCNREFLDHIQNNILLLDQLLEYDLKFNNFQSSSIEVSVSKNNELHLDFLLDQDLGEQQLQQLILFRKRVRRAGIRFLYSKLNNKISFERIEGGIDVNIRSRSRLRTNVLAREM